MKKSYVQLFFIYTETIISSRQIFIRNIYFYNHFNTCSNFKNSPKKSISNMKILI